MGGKNLKSVNQYKYRGAVLDTELPDYKDIQSRDGTVQDFSGPDHP